MTRFTRRGLLRTGAAAGVLAATGLPLKAQASRGGRLRMGLNGANTSDSWDSRTHSDIFMISAAPLESWLGLALGLGLGSGLGSG